MRKPLSIKSRGRDSNPARRGGIEASACDHHPSESPPLRPSPCGRWPTASVVQLPDVSAERRRPLRRPPRPPGDAVRSADPQRGTGEHHRGEFAQPAVDGGAVDPPPHRPPVEHRLVVVHPVPLTSADRSTNGLFVHRPGLLWTGRRRSSASPGGRTPCTRSGLTWWEARWVRQRGCGTTCPARREIIASASRTAMSACSQAQRSQYSGMWPTR